MMGKLWRWLIDWRSHLKTLAMVLLVALAVNAWQSRHVPAGPDPAQDVPLLTSPNLNNGASLQAWLARHCLLYTSPSPRDCS